MSQSKPAKNPKKRRSPASPGDFGLFNDFWKEYTDFSPLPEGNMIYFGDNIYIVPPNMPDIRGIRVLRPGLHLGSIQKDRFIPSHALALWLDPRVFKNRFDIPPEDRQLGEKYLRGETFNTPDPGLKGWVLITFDGIALGWGKAAGGLMKNHYPKGLRRV